MNTLDFKEGQTYICTKSDSSWWTVGKEYDVVLNRWNQLCLVDDNGSKWTHGNLNNADNQFELNQNQPKLVPKEGQTYVCKRDDLEGWTLDKEYRIVFYECLGLVIVDDEGCKWYLPNDELLNNVFKLKEQTFDLNKLTTAQLKEYIGLFEDNEKSERLLTEFIERMTK